MIVNTQPPYVNIKYLSLLGMHYHACLSDHELIMNGKLFLMFSSLMIRIGIPHYSTVKGTLIMRNGLMLTHNF